MNLSLGKEIAVSTTYIKSNPAVPIYSGVESPENLYAVIYHIEIGYNEKQDEKIKQYIIIDYKNYELSEVEKQNLMDVAKTYCESKNIDIDRDGEIVLLDNEEAESFLEKVFNNMKVIRGLITKRD
jgi:hypothetical protein